MNLIQVQDDLKSLPNSPQTMQALMQYANGSNPQVPPYLALTELNRRKMLEEKYKQQQQAQGGQQQQGTLKDQLTQSAGLLALHQQRQKQAMEQMANRSTSAPGAVPQPVEQFAPVQASPVQAAKGGLLKHLMGYSAMRRPAVRYNSGGIVAFNEAGSVDDRIREMTARQETDADYGYGTVDGEQGYDPENELRRRKAEAAALRASGPRREDYDTEARRRAFEKAYPDLAAAANKNIGQASLQRLDEYQQLVRGELERQRQEAASARPSVWQQMGQAALATRGRSGTDALAAILGGYSSIAEKQKAKELEQEQGLRGKELDLKKLRMDAENKLEEAERARAEGRMGDYAKGMQEFEKANNTFRVAAMGAVGREITAGESAAARKQVANTYAQQRRDTAGKGGRTSDLQALAQATTDYQLDPTPENKAKLDGLRAAFRQSKPEFANIDAIAQDLISQNVPPTQAYATAAVQYRAAGAGVTSQGANVKAAREAVRKEKILDPVGWEAKVKRYGSEQAAEDAEVDAYLARATSAPFKPNLSQNSAPRGTAANPIKIPD